MHTRTFTDIQTQTHHTESYKTLMSVHRECHQIPRLSLKLELTGSARLVGQQALYIKP